LEKTAQYNHTAEGRKKPPFCPWRIEVGDPSQERERYSCTCSRFARSKFISLRKVQFVPPAGVAIGDRWIVRFQPTGPLGGGLGDQPLTTMIQTNAQYTGNR